MKKKPEDLRSFRWFGPASMRGFSHRSRMQQLGHRREDFVGKPVVAIINTWSEINPCHAHLRERAEAAPRQRARPDRYTVRQSPRFPWEESKLFALFDRRLR